jgi:V-type H+-transporting ATPase subunit H
LQWSPAHKSDNFWKANIGKFKEQDWKILKELAQIINESQDSLVLAVACSDISYIINELPESARLLEKLGAKVKIMSLMNSSDPEVRFEALTATQTFITHSFK